MSAPTVGRKRKNFESERYEQLMQTGLSDTQLHAVLNIFRENAPSLRTVQRQVGVLLEDDSAIYVKQELQAIKGKPVELWHANIQSLYSHICAKSEIWKDLLHTAGATLSVLLYADEIQAGNILHPLQGKKITFFYCTVKELGPFLLKKPATWFPVAAVVYADVARTLGGTSAIFKALIRDFMAITQPCQIHVDLPLVHLRIAGVVADMDAQRAIFASKGSAGWKPCLFCSNICKDLEHLDTSIFFTVASEAVSKFKMTTDEDLFEAYDGLLREKPMLRKKDWERRCKVLGLEPSAQTLLGDPAARLWLPPSKALNDYMHVYLNNGIASWEVISLLERLKQRCDVGLEALQTFAADQDWKTARPGCSAAFRRHLFVEKKFTETFRGPAFELAMLLPLLQFFLETTVPEAMEQELHCFRHLVEICRQYHRLLARHGFPLLPLQRLQEAHQGLTMELYGQSYAKPKHHHRFHIPLQAEKMYLGILCFEFFVSYLFGACWKAVKIEAMYGHDRSLRGKAP